jgi:hypothetical protein
MSAALKEYYHGQKVNDLVYKKNPMFALLKKDTKAGGKVIPVPLQYGVSMGRSADFATAQVNQTAAQLAEFMLTRKHDYAIATIDNETLEATQDDAEAFVAASKIHIDSAFKVITLSLASGLFRTGTGSIGQSDGISTGVITLSDPLQATQFEPGMTLTAHATDGAAARGALGYVLAVNVTTGQITVSDTSLTGSAGTPASWSNSVGGDFLCVQGDVNAKVSGLAAWLPIVRSGLATSFYGVNRSIHPTRLAGVYYDGSLQAIEEAIIDVSNLAAEQGGSPDKFITNYRTYSALVKSLGTRVQYVDLESDANIGFRGIRIHGDDGEIDVIPDHNCQGKLGFLLDMNSLTLRSVGDAPHIVTYGKEGLEMLRVSNADAAEVRIAYYANLECNAPGWNAVVALGA